MAKRTVRSRHVLLGVVIGALLVLPSAVLAADRFGDAIAEVHRAGVGFVADAGVTVGCGDGSYFCPQDPVTRAQMATFLHRLSGHADGVAPAVDAATVQGMAPAQLRGQPGPAGPTGPQGPTGPPGADGQDAATEMLPIAFGGIGGGGESLPVSVRNGSGNFTATWETDDGRGWYEIDIDGVDYSGFGNSATVTPRHTAGCGFPGLRTFISNSNLGVEFDGDVHQACSFDFVVHASPGEDQ